MTLTKGMNKALNQIGYGVKATDRGYMAVDGVDERLDLRSAEALHKRGLVFYRYNYGRGTLRLTEEGQKIFDENN